MAVRRCLNAIIAITATTTAMAAVIKIHTQAGI